MKRGREDIPPHPGVSNSNVSPTASMLMGGQNDPNKHPRRLDYAGPHSTNIPVLSHPSPHAHVGQMGHGVPPTLPPMASHESMESYPGMQRGGSQPPYMISSPRYPPPSPHNVSMSKPPNSDKPPTSMYTMGTHQPPMAHVGQSRHDLIHPPLPAMHPRPGPPNVYHPSSPLASPMHRPVGPPHPPPQPPNGHPPPVHMGAQPQGRQIKFESALDFLDQVKLQFAEQPKVYNQFLDIMKDFKAQCIDTPGVIARVSELFKGHKNLIFGFNTFLPPGYKIEAVPDDEPVVITTPSGAMPASISIPQQVSVPPPAPQPPLIQPPPAAPAVPAAATGNLNPGRKALEFDHARGYVKKIKQRFALQPHVYKSFLKILHTYHQEQHTIKDVYEHVAVLFAKHPDLLDEFTQFLPDPMAAQPPAAAPSRSKKPTRKKEKVEKVEKVERERVELSRDRNDRAMDRSMKTERQLEKEARERREAERIAEEKERMTEKKNTRRKETRSEAEKVQQSSYEEIEFFNRIKQRMNNQSLYTEFLKCLTMFSQGILSKAELGLMVKDLLSKHRDLFDWFRNFIGLDATALENLERSDSERAEEIIKPPVELDYKNMRRYGPSYRGFPKNYVPVLCSGRTPLCNSVLNDMWVSVCIGSEDSFKSSRHNQFEEMLFKCDDDRFELDLVIECNMHCIRVLEEIPPSLPSQDEDTPLTEELDVVCRRNIERIYGEKAMEMLECLYERPLAVLPVLVRRLKMKDQEWVKTRREWNKIWREVSDKNYYKAIDYQSFQFKQTDKKSMANKVLLADIKQRLKRREEEPKRRGRERDVSIMDESSTDRPDEESHKPISSGPQLEFTLSDPTMFDNMFELVSFCAEKNNINKAERERIDTFFKKFVKVFFFIDKLPIPNKEDKLKIFQEKTEKREGKEDEDKMDVEKEEETIPPMIDANGKRSQVFYGNNSFYCMFRLLQILYDRLSKAKDMAYAQSTSSNFAYLLNTKETFIGGEERYKLFLKNLWASVSNAKESNTYEEECRSLLGNGAYVLFTMGTVISTFTKQLQTVLAEEDCNKLLALYSSMATKSNAERDNAYHSHCISLLGEDKCYRFEFEFSPKVGLFTIELLDSAHHPPRYIDFSVTPVTKHAKWLAYVENWLKEDGSALESKRHNVFLKRNVRKAKKEGVRADIVKDYQLEARVSLTNFRLFYVTDTTDFLFRKMTPSVQTVDPSKKSARLDSVVEKIKHYKATAPPPKPAPETTIPSKLVEQVLNASETAPNPTLSAMDAAIITSAAENADHEKNTMQGETVVPVQMDVAGAVTAATTALDNAIIQNSMDEK
ncbi:paired amphipathic helix containing protein [Planoprotostelium fungivorum]|uniref:Paired amphipathic helix containing protein n=1 Tax=Planoprotostelium fungivorum TaxID=1890364 RepID=A0A2P6NXF3_9EUKA|nr:paired amphipathic helix containing protein [Planoprotostelium fungivorum]